MTKFKKFIKGEQSHLQRQVVIELRPASFIYCQLKNSSPKVVASYLKKYLLFLFSSYQTTYAERRNISKGGKLFSDTLQITDFLEFDGLLWKIDEIFSSVN